MPANVLTLKNSVPTNWTSAATLSVRVCDVRSCRNAAAVKNTEPTKKVTPIAGRGADAHCEANDAIAKHAEPMPNSAPIHQLTRSGPKPHDGDARRGRHDLHRPQGVTSVLLTGRARLS